MDVIHPGEIGSSQKKSKATSYYYTVVLKSKPLSGQFDCSDDGLHVLRELRAQLVVGLIARVDGVDVDIERRQAVFFLDHVGDDLTAGPGVLAADVAHEDRDVDAVIRVHVVDDAEPVFGRPGRAVDHRGVEHLHRRDILDALPVVHVVKKDTVLVAEAVHDGDRAVMGRLTPIPMASVDTST